MGLASVHLTNAAALVVMQPGIIGDIYCLTISYLTGEVKGPPKVWLRTVRRVMAHFEEKARQAGCKEIRIGGRRWQRVFPDWLPNPRVTYGLRKVL